MDDSLIKKEMSNFRCKFDLPEARKGDLENKQRAEWLKYKGMDTFDAMQLYIEKVKELAQVYSERQILSSDDSDDNQKTAEGASKK